jgi:glycosyltransferase involved in cell wall biosynthesis
MGALVSVIVPAYNSEKHIKETMQSVLAQTYCDFELLIIDDGSTDGTADVVRSFKDGRIKYLHFQNGGPAVAKNRGIKHSSGEYLAFLDSDDTWHLEKLEKQVCLMRSDPRIGMIFCNISIMSAQGELLGQKTFKKEQTLGLEHILRSCFITTPSSVMLRRNCLEAVGGFDEELWCSDWELYVRIYRRYLVDYVNEALVNYRSSNQGLSGRVDVLNKTRPRILDKIWAGDPRLSKEYPEIKKACYADTYFEIGEDNFNALNLSTARKFLIKSLLIKPLKFRTYHYLIRTFLGVKIFSFLKSIKSVRAK